MVPTYLKQTWYFFRANLGAIMQIQLPFIILITLISMSAMDSIDVENPQMNNSIAMFYICSLILLPLYAGATIAYLESVVRDNPISTLTALKIGLSRWGSLFLAKIIGAFGIVLGLFFFFVPGIYVLIRWGFTEYHCIIEKDSPVEALRNSWHDTSEFFWPLLNGLAVLFVILFGANVIIEGILSSAGLMTPAVRAVMDVLFGFMNCLYTIYGYRLYCVMRESGHPAEQE